METPKIQINNDCSDQEGQVMVIFQTAPHAGWKKVTAWRVPVLPKGASAEMEIPEGYSIALEYVRNEVTVTTESISVDDGIGSFKITGIGRELQLKRVAHNPESNRLEVEAETNFEGYVELLIFKGKERVFPKIQLGPGWRTTPELNGPYYIARFPHGRAGADFPELLASPKLEVKPWDKVQLTGEKEKGYSLKGVGKLRYP